MGCAVYIRGRFSKSDTMAQSTHSSLQSFFFIIQFVFSFLIIGGIIFVGVGCHFSVHSITVHIHRILFIHNENWLNMRGKTTGLKFIWNYSSPVLHISSLTQLLKCGSSWEPLLKFGTKKSAKIIFNYDQGNDVFLNHCKRPISLIFNVPGRLHMAVAVQYNNGRPNECRKYWSREKYIFLLLKRPIYLDSFVELRLSVNYSKRKHFWNTL